MSSPLTPEAQSSKPETHFWSIVNRKLLGIRKITNSVPKSRVMFNCRSNRSNYGYTLLRDILSLRKKLLESRTSQPAKTPLAVLRMKRKSVKSRSDFDDRVAKRYFKELNLIKQGEDADVRYSSEDENFPSKSVLSFEDF